MKKLLTVLTLFLLFLLNFNFVFAKEDVKLDTSSPSTKSAASYSLPYPGLLPDNPLYIFKVARDAIIRFFISDPLKKAEYDLLQADKRLNAGYYLSLKNIGKDKIVVSTVSKGENYFENSLKETLQAKNQGADTNDILRRLVASSKKHQEI